MRFIISGEKKVFNCVHERNGRSLDEFICGAF